MLPCPQEAHGLGDPDKPTDKDAGVGKAWKLWWGRGYRNRREELSPSLRRMPDPVISEGKPDGK